MNLLASTANGVIGYGVKPVADVHLNFIGDFIRILIEGIGIVGVGIIVFTLILKTVVLPLDIYSRIKGKKQALIMERMRPQMEKLQKQYANDQTMYKQKVMELQRASGYSAFGACLPMIVSLVIFIVVFSAFSTYSQYANLHSYNQMVGVYNDVVQEYVIDATDEYGNPIKDENGVIQINGNGFLLEVILNQTELEENRAAHEKDEKVKLILAEKDYEADYSKFAAVYNSERETSLSEDEVFNALAEEYNGRNSDYQNAYDKEQINKRGADGELTLTAKEIRNSLVSFYLEEPAAKEVYKYFAGKDGYSAHNDGFLWVGNLWYPDSTLNKVIPDFSKFRSTVTKAEVNDAYEESYNKVTYYLRNDNPDYPDDSVPGNHYNGYFILIVLSIGLMILQQIITMKSNKAVNELSTVDGQGARTNKWMLILMPVIYGIFSFFYSASFSIYMITNTVYGIITMVVINKAVNVWFKRKEAAGKLDEVLNKRKRPRGPGGRGRK